MVLGHLEGAIGEGGARRHRTGLWKTNIEISKQEACWPI